MFKKLKSSGCVNTANKTWFGLKKSDKCLMLKTSFSLGCVSTLGLLGGFFAPTNHLARTASVVNQTTVKPGIPVGVTSTKNANFDWANQVVSTTNSLQEYLQSLPVSYWEQFYKANPKFFPSEADHFLIKTKLGDVLYKSSLVWVWLTVNSWFANTPDTTLQLNITVAPVAHVKTVYFFNKFKVNGVFVKGTWLHKLVLTKQNYFEYSSFTGYYHAWGGYFWGQMHINEGVTEITPGAIPYVWKGLTLWKGWVAQVILPTTLRKIDSPVGNGRTTPEFVRFRGTVAQTMSHPFTIAQEAFCSNAGDIPKNPDGSYYGTWTKNIDCGVSGAASAQWRAYVRAHPNLDDGFMDQPR